MTDTHRHQAYEYSPLQGNEYIRLLAIFPNKDIDAAIRCSLSAHPFDGDIIGYTALSYTWGRHEDGDDTLNREIFVEGGILQVTENLHNAIRRLRPSRGSPLLLWVDAVCIYQKNSKERNAQVAIMAKIYARASTMVIWLGEKYGSVEDVVANEVLEAAPKLLDRARQQVPDDARPPDISRLLLSLNIGPIVESQTRNKFYNENQAENDSEANAGIKHKRDVFSRILRKKSYYRAAITEQRIDESCSAQIEKSKSSEDLFDYAWSAMLSRFSTNGAEQRNSAQLLTDIDLHLYFMSFLRMAREFRSKFGQKDILLWLLRGSYDKLVEHFNSRLVTVASLFRRRYFFRRWVIQEIYHSRNIPTIVQWGEHAMSLPDFLSNAEALVQLVRRHEQHRPYLSVKWAETQRQACDWILRSCKLLTVQSLHDTVSASGYRVLEYLHRFQSLACSDPRDRLYALASLSEGFSTIKPDYSLPTSAVYSNFAKCLLRHGEVEWVLDSALKTREAEKVTKLVSHSDDILKSLPSWVPNFQGFIWEKFPVDISKQSNVDEITTLIERPCPTLPVGETQERVICLPARIGLPVRDYEPSAIHYTAAVRFASGLTVEYYGGYPGIISGSQVVCCIPSKAGRWATYILERIAGTQNCFTLIRHEDLEGNRPHGHAERILTRKEGAYHVDVKNYTKIKEEHTTHIWIV